jgi:hypothetical protein
MLWCEQLFDEQRECEQKLRTERYAVKELHARLDGLRAAARQAVPALTPCAPSIDAVGEEAGSGGDSDVYADSDGEETGSSSQDEEERVDGQDDQEDSEISDPDDPVVVAHACGIM